MKEQSLPYFYAGILFNLSKKKQKGRQWVSDLQKIVPLFQEEKQESKTLLKILNSPLISPHKKKALLTRLFQGKIDDTLLFFLMQLADQNRFQLVPKIFNLFSLKMDEIEGVLRVELTVPIQLDETNRKRLEHKLTEAYQKKVQINQKIDPSILGGMILHFFDNKMLDYSLKTRLIELQTSLGS